MVGRNESIDVRSRYTAWNNYQYNQHGNAAAAAAAYPYGAADSSMVSNTVPSNYQQYSQHQSNSQYSYGAADPSEYYPQYAYGAQHATSNVYADPNGRYFLLPFTIIYSSF